MTDLLPPHTSALSNTGWRRYERAKQLIPGGTQLLSKRPEMFLPQEWPCYYSRAKGCHVWDLDGRQYVDMTTSGIGACLLGYADEEVDAAVKQAIDRGGMCTLNAPVEVDLAELLLELHPWAHQARFLRTGGEAMAAAVRIARAATNRSRIAFCGYHGWSDWYLAANLSHEKALDGHLLPGLAPRGVPRELAGTAVPFRYNRIEELEAIAADAAAPLAAIVLEPMRMTAPADGFLEKVRRVADRTGAVLIVDEISAGWRSHLGGLHLKLNVRPDMAVFAKAMSNGYPMAAILGVAPVMQAAQESFISSTFWTEALGPTAALATIRKLRRCDVPAHTAAIGQLAQSTWNQAAQRHHLNITINGLPALCSFTLNYGDQAQALQTLLTQAMLERGYLANTTFYPTLAHTPAVMNDYADALDESFALLKEAMERNEVMDRLHGPVAHRGFSRLT